MHFGVKFICQYLLALDYCAAYSHVYTSHKLHDFCNWGFLCNLYGLKYLAGLDSSTCNSLGLSAGRPHVWSRVVLLVHLSTHIELVLGCAEVA